MGDATGAVVSIVANVNTGFYAGGPNIPFPNTPVVRG